MEDTLITFETAKLAKDKGFKEKVIYYYHLHDDLKKPLLINEVEILLKNYKTPYEVRRDWNTISTEFGYTENFSAPTQSLLAKWLREEHNIHFEIKPIFDVKDNLKPYHISVIKNPSGKDFEYEIVGSLDTYEETLEIGLQEALKLIK